METWTGDPIKLTNSNNSEYIQPYLLPSFKSSKFKYLPTVNKTSSTFKHLFTKKESFFHSRNRDLIKRSYFFQICGKMVRSKTIRLTNNKIENNDTSYKLAVTNLKTTMYMCQFVVS